MINLKHNIKITESNPSSTCSFHIRFLNVYETNMRCLGKNIHNISNQWSMISIALEAIINCVAIIKCRYFKCCEKISEYTHVSILNIMNISRVIFYWKYMSINYNNILIKRIYKRCSLSSLNLLKLLMWRFCKK